MTWHLKWLIGLVVYLPVALAGFWRLWWKRGPSASNRNDKTRRTVYLSNRRANCSYTLGNLAFYYAVYVVISLAPPQRISGSEAMLHLAFWTLAPPLWFFVEWFLWFDNHEDDLAVKNLRIAQDLASNSGQLCWPRCSPSGSVKSSRTPFSTAVREYT